MSLLAWAVDNDFERIWVRVGPAQDNALAEAESVLCPDDNYRLVLEAEVTMIQTGTEYEPRLTETYASWPPDPQDVQVYQRYRVEET